MTTLRTTAAATLLCLATAWAHSAPPGPASPSKAFGACMDKSGGVTVAMLDCLGAETRLQDARLNATYKLLMADVSAARKKQLQDAQRAWIKYRDANCGFYADPEGGTLANVSASDCMMQMTLHRAHELEMLRQG